MKIGERNDAVVDRVLTRFGPGSKAEAEAFWLLTQQYDVGLVELLDVVWREVMKQLCDPEEDHDRLLAAMEAQSRDGLRLDAGTNLLVALHEAHRDMRHDAQRMSASPAPSLAELISMHRRAVGWFWFWSIRWPDAARRAGFAQMAAEREAVMERLLERGRRLGVVK